MCRYAEGTITENYIRKKCRLSEAVWQRLGEDDSLIEKIEDEKLKRCRDGSSKREKAQQLVVKAVDVLGGIALDDKASPKHRIDASKTLDAFAANAPQTTPATAAAERFCIVINMGGDEVLKFDKLITPRPHDGIGHDAEDDQLRTPWGLIAANKQTEGGGGEPL
jgi:hypothetical protein